MLDFLRHLGDFLYPKSTRVINLEALTSDNLWKILPPSTLNEENTVAVFNYSHPLVKEIVWEIKYKGNHILADKLGEILYDVIESELEDRMVYEKFEKILLLPTPISDKRRFERGWNQSELLAKSIKERDKAQKIKYLPRQLIKVVHTESQTHTSSRSERLKNLHRSMKVLNPEAIRGKFVVLVDDVTTTGSTFTEAKRALKEAGVKKTLCIALAH